MSDSQPAGSEGHETTAGEPARPPPLLGVTVHCTGLDAEQRDALRSHAEGLGGSFQSKMDLKHLPTVLVARSVLSEKYKVRGPSRCRGTMHACAQLQVTSSCKCAS